MPENIDRSKIPTEAFKCNLPMQIEFAKDDRQNTGGFDMTLYDGSVVSHWYWGNLAFDLSTMKLKKKRIGVLDEHNTSRRVGVSEEATFDKKFKVSGRFLSNEYAQGIRRDGDEGFPFEGSMSFDPKLTKKIEQVVDGQIAECNGKEVKGPGAIIRGAVIDEVSICVHGALANTKTSTFSEMFKESEIMADEKTKLTKEQFAKDYPDIYQEVLSEGIQSEMKRFTDFSQHFADNPAFLVEQFTSGASLNDAILAENALLKQQAKMNLDKEKPAEIDENKVDPAVQEFSDEQKPPEKETENDNANKTATEKFMDIARKFASDRKMKLSRAISECSESHCKEYRAMLDENTQITDQSR